MDGGRTVAKPSVRTLLTDLWADADEVVRRHLTDQRKLHQAYALAARVEKMLALHRRDQRRQWTDEEGCAHRGGFVCAHCDHAWPCPTRRLLDGEDE